LVTGILTPILAFTLLLGIGIMDTCSDRVEPVEVKVLKFGIVRE